jgi:hypothetical protein
MKLLGALITIMLINIVATAQSVTYTDLSKKFIYQVNITRVKQADETIPKAAITFLILNRNKSVIQKFNLKSEFLFEEAYKNNKTSRSYITGFNKNAETPDNDFGDLIIADLNFDGKEDIAIKHDSGGNGGPFYNFYLQDTSGHFILSKYLTTCMGAFPINIDAKGKTLTTNIHTNVRGYNQTTYKYNIKTKQWIRSQSVFIKA